MPFCNRRGRVVGHLADEVGPERNLKWGIRFVHGIEMDADGGHASRDFKWRLNVDDTLLQRSWTVACHVLPSLNANRPVLMPTERPIFAR